MVTPGLLPEADDRRFNPRLLLPWLIVLVLFGFIFLRRPAPAPVPPPPPAPKEDVGRIKELEAQIAELKKAPPPAPVAVEAAPVKAPELRILPPELAAERLTQGLHEFRSGRYAQAEACFLRAIPEGFLYVALCCLARGDLRDASLFLARAMKADPQWLRRIRPRDLFGNPEDFEKTLRSLEERVRDNPLDAEAKTLLAYLHFHEKGPEFAKALMTEVAGAHPEDPHPKAFLESIDKP